MKKLLVVVLLTSILQTVKAQFFIKPVYYLTYSFYSWHQRPYEEYPPQNLPFGDTRSVGQAMNIVPGVGAGIILGDKRCFAFSLEGQANYYPFSIDLITYKGMGAASFPVMGFFHIFFDGLCS